MNMYYVCLLEDFGQALISREQAWTDVGVCVICLVWHKCVCVCVCVYIYMNVQKNVMSFTRNFFWLALGI
jgi:hypothetical protein